MFRPNISLSIKFLLAAFLCLGTAQAQMSTLGAGGTKGASAPTKSYSFLAAYDWQQSGSPTAINFSITMTGTAGRLIVSAASQNFAITSVVYDPTGANVTLTQDASFNSGLEGWWSANVPSASGTKTVTITYAGTIGFNSQSAAFWLATNLTTGFDSANFALANTVSMTVNSGDFLFAINYPSAANSWSANSTSAPTGNRLSNTATFGSVQLSATADWVSPTVGAFTVGAGPTSAIWAATYK